MSVIQTMRAAQVLMLEARAGQALLSRALQPTKATPQFAANDQNDVPPHATAYGAGTVGHNRNY